MYNPRVSDVRLRSLLEVLALLTVIAVALANAALPIALPAKVAVAAALALPCGYLYGANRGAFVPALFFVIHALLSPLVFVSLERLGFQIPQIYLLPSMAVYLAIVVPVPRLRRHLHWLRGGAYDRPTWVLSVVLVAGSAVALIAWTLFLAGDLSRYEAFVPDVPLWLILIYGPLFAAMNSIFEEFLARAAMYDGFAAVLRRPTLYIPAQALVFAAWHFNGFPGGFVGAGMVFVWSLFLGAIRRSSGGMLAPLVAHFFADLTIALILLFAVVLPAG